MITNLGKKAFRRFVAGYTRNLITTIVVGTGARAESADDTTMGHELTRLPVTGVGLDEVNSRVVFKATLPSYMSAVIYEVAGFSDAIQQASEGSTGGIFNVGDNEFWEWGTGVEEYGAAERVGERTVKLSPASGATESATLSINQDLSLYSNQDLFNIAYTAVGSLSNVTVRLKSSPVDYYTLSFANVGTGYKITRLAKSTATATGSPSWASIIEVEVRATATGGTGEALIDSFRIDTASDYTNGQVLYDRRLVSPITKIAGRPLDVEFSVPITFP